MKVQASKLQPGTILMSGEEVISVSKMGKFNNVEAWVTLRRTDGSTRIATWGMV